SDEPGGEHGEHDDDEGGPPRSAAHGGDESQWEAELLGSRGAQSRGRGVQRTGHAAIRSTARSRTDRARGLSSDSCSPACSAPRVSWRNAASRPAGTNGRSRGTSVVVTPAKARLVMRSSSEWYARTTTRPPGATMSRACGRARSY